MLATGASGPAASASILLFPLTFPLTLLSPLYPLATSTASLYMQYHSLATRLLARGPGVFVDALAVPPRLPLCLLLNLTVFGMQA